MLFFLIPPCGLDAYPGEGKEPTRSFICMIGHSNTGSL